MIDDFRLKKSMPSIYLKNSLVILNWGNLFISFCKNFFFLHSSANVLKVICGYDIYICVYVCVCLYIYILSMYMLLFGDIC